MFWIFQGNPDYFQIDKYLKEYNPIRWKVTRYRNKIKVNDIVFIWRASGQHGETSGVVAKGVILTKPKEMDDDAPHLWKDKTKSGDKTLRVVIEVLETRLSVEDGMLTADLLEKILPDLDIFRFPQATNFKLTREHGYVINALWEALRP